MKYYGMLLAAVILLALDFALNKVYQRRAGTSPKAGFRFNAMLGIFTAAIFWVANGFQLHFSAYSMLLAAGFAITVMLYNLCGFRIMKQGSMAQYTLFLMSGGMLLPYLCGLIFWDEPFSWLRTAGLAVILVAVAFSNGGEKFDKRILGLCCAVFVLNGLTGICSKLNQIETVLPVADATEFVVYTGLTRFVMAGIGYLCCKKDEEFTESKAKAAVWPLILLSAVLDGTSYFLQLVGASNLPATVLFPFVTGGTMVFSALAGMILFKEKPSRRVLLGILLSFVGTLLFL